jgi:hypothetical protein
MDCGYAANAMTTLIAWVSYPQSKVATAVYLASDSRITWGSKNKRWDAGRKLFTTGTSAHAFGYCGDVVFPSLVLAQVTTTIDQSLLFEESAAPDDKHAAVLSVIKGSFDRRHDAPDNSFSIVHAHRAKSGRATRFCLWRIDYNHRTRAWTDSSVDLPQETATIVELGTGAKKLRSHSQRWNTSDVGGTSRSVYAAFCDALRSGSDPLSGGAPQLAGLYTKGPAQPLGVWYKGCRYLHGLPLVSKGPSSRLEWRDELFQSVDGDNGSPLHGARRYARPAFR